MSEVFFLFYNIFSILNQSFYIIHTHIVFLHSNILPIQIKNFCPNNFPNPPKILVLAQERRISRIFVKTPPKKQPILDIFYAVENTNYSETFFFIL